MVKQPKAKMACDICGDLLYPSRMMIHKALKHPASFVPSAELSDVKAKLTESEVKIISLEKSLSEKIVSTPVAELSDVDRNAILSDWIEGLTSEAWELIGKERGFMVDPDPEPAQAQVSDVEPQSIPAPAPRKIKKFYSWNMA